MSTGRAEYLGGLLPFGGLPLANWKPAGVLCWPAVEVLCQGAAWVLTGLSLGEGEGECEPGVGGDSSLPWEGETGDPLELGEEGVFL